MIVFYYSPNSSSVTTHWVLEELGISYEKVRVHLDQKDQDKPGFRALNPNGKVPLIVHDGTPIFESGAITMHLGEMYGVEKKLYPGPGLQRGEAMKWIVWASVSLHTAIMKKDYAEAESKAEIDRLLGILDAALHVREWILGDSFSLVDVHVASWTGYAAMRGFDIMKFPKVAAWLSTCGSRKANAVAMSP